MLKVIGFGGENIVRANDHKEVYKTPLGIRYFINPNETCKELVSDLEILKKYFGDYLAQTEIDVKDTSSTKPTYIMIQKYIKGQALTKTHFSNPIVQLQFNDILNINNKMVHKENKSYEFFGVWTLLFGFFITRLNNIRVENKTNKLYIIDVGTIYLHDDYHSKVLKMLYRWAYKKQTRLLKNFEEL